MARTQKEPSPLCSLDKVERRPIRLVGISLSGFADSECKQLTLFDAPDEGKSKIDNVTMNLQRKYGLDIVKSGSELIAEKRLGNDKKSEDFEV